MFKKNNCFILRMVKLFKRKFYIIIIIIKLGSKIRFFFSFLIKKLLYAEKSIFLTEQKILFKLTPARKYSLNKHTLAVSGE